MITVSVSALPEGPYAEVGRGQLSFSWGVPVRLYDYWGFLLSAHYPPSYSDEYVLGPYGSIHQDSVTYGRLRDKGVNHLNVSGDLVVSSNTIQAGQTEDGWPYAYLSDGVTVHPYTAVVAWAQPTEFVQTWVPVPNNAVPGGEIFSQPSGVIITRRVRFGSDDKALVVTEILRTPVYKNGVLFRSQEIVSVIEKIRRDAELFTLYDMGLATAYSSLSETEVAAYFATFGNSGGTLLSSLSLQQGNGCDVESFLAELDSSVRTEIRSLDLFSRTNPFSDFGTLALQCSQQMRYIKSDVMDALFDVAEFEVLLSTWTNVVKSPLWSRLHALATESHLKNWSYRRYRRYVSRQLKLGSKTTTDLFLSTKYGLFPNVSDVETLISAFRAFSRVPQFRRLHSRSVTPIDYPNAVSGLHTAVLTVEVGAFPNDLGGFAAEIVAGYKRFGAWPEMSHLWDRLIFSFVVDWFVQFGNLFKDCDNWLTVKYYFPVDHCILSEKWEMTKSVTDLVPGYPVTGTVDFSYYVRWITREVPLPPVALTAESSVGIHSLEAFALVLQRLL